MTKWLAPRSAIGILLITAALIALPFVAAMGGQAWVRIVNFAILYIFLALGLNIVVGFAGLLDLGYIAFYAVGAYTWALLASPHFGLHWPFWAILPIGAVIACFFGVLLGSPTLKLRGDYLAIVTLGFGEIVRIFLNNLNAPINVTNGPQGITLIDPVKFGDFSFSGTTADSRRFAEWTAEVLLPAGARWRFSSSSSTCGCSIPASAVPGRLSARTRSPPRRSASIPATSSCWPSPWAPASAALPAVSSRRCRASCQPGELLADRIDHDPRHGGPRRHGAHPGRHSRRRAADGRCRRSCATASGRLQVAVFGKMLIDPESLRMLIFGLALVLVMRFQPAGLWPSPERKRELQGEAVMAGVLLEAKAVAKHFGGVKALRDVSLTIRQGEIYGLIGPNGAGKTTFFNCMTGLYVPDGGGFTFDGAPLLADAPHKAAERGHRPDFPEHPPVRQHDRARERHGRPSCAHPCRGLRRDAAECRDACRGSAPSASAPIELLHYVGIADRADDLAKNLSYGDQRRLEIARALATEPSLLCARRAGGRHERHRNRGAAQPDRRHPPRRHDRPAHRA